MSQVEKRKVLILGSGPAGLTAAIYSSRARLEPLLVHGPLAGGQLTTTTDVENFPGFADGIMGPDLMQTMEKQAVRFGTTLETDVITEARLDVHPFVLKSDKKEYHAEALIIATGASPKYLGLPKERELLGYGVSTCATCDGAFFRNVEIAVVGGGDSACEESLFLTKFASKVYLIHRRDELRASKIMQDRVLRHEKIEMIWNSTVSDIEGDKQSGVKSLTLKNLVNGETKTLPCNALFVAIGHTPNAEIFSKYLDRDEAGYLKVKSQSTATNIEGVFACGDVQDKTFRQAITAAGTGCMAAIEAERWLESKEH